MNLELAIQLLMLLPPIHFGTPAAVEGAAPAGSGTLLITLCEPRAAVMIEPGNIRAVADADGVIMVKAPAQRETDEPYSFLGKTFNGTLTQGQSLSASCL